MAGKNFKCLVCKDVTHICAGSEGYKHLDRVHPEVTGKHAIGVTHVYTNEERTTQPRVYIKKEDGKPTERHCICLICNDNFVRGYSGTYNHIESHHPGIDVKLGITHEYTTLPTSVSDGYRRRIPKQQISPQQQTSNAGYVDIPCILRINILTHQQVVILGDNKNG